MDSARAKLRDPTSKWVHVIGWLALTLAVGWVWLRLIPPEAVERDAPKDQFSAERALDFLGRLASEPRPLGSPGHRRAQGLLRDRLTQLGLSFEPQETTSAMRIGARVTSAHLTNYLARIPGREPKKKALLLVAHYDTVPHSPGASDDGAAVAVLLETARALLQGPRLERDVWLLFTDGEELGLLGAAAFVKQHPLASRVGAILNFEARGSHGPVAMYDVTGPAGILIDKLAESGSRPITSSFVTSLSRLMPNDSDLSVFREQGIPGMGFAFADGLEHYHHPTDSLASLDIRSVQHMGNQALEVSRAIASSSGATLASPTPIFFDLGGTCVVRYSKWVAVSLGLFGFVWACSLVIRALRGRPKGLRDLARTMAVIPCWLLVAMIIGLLCEIALIGASGMVGAAVGNKLAALACFGFVLAILGLLAKTRSGLVLEAGLVWAAGLLLLMSLWLPELTPPLIWPFFWVLAATEVERRWMATRPHLVWVLHYLSLLVALPVAFPAVYALVMAGGPSALFLAALGFAAYLPVFPWLLAGPKGRTPALLGIAVVCLGLGLWQSKAAAARLRTDTLIHAFDADTGKAFWLTHAEESSPWVSKWVPPGAPRASLPEYSASPRSYRYAPARRQPLDVAGELTVEKQQQASGEHIFDLRLRSNANCVELWQEAGSPLHLVDLEGRHPSRLIRFSAEADTKLMRLTGIDRSQSPFHWIHCGLTDTDLRFRLASRAAAMVTIRILEAYAGLPEPFDGDDASRSSGCFPSLESDRSLVSRQFRF